MEQWLKKRYLIIKIIFLAILLFILYTHFNYAVINREELLKIGNKLAWRQGVLFPPRGRILDANKKKLAWTERYYDFIVKEKFCDEKYIEDINRALKVLRKSTFKKIPPQNFTVRNLKNDNVIIYGLKPEVDLKEINNEINKFNFFAIKPRVVRLVVDHGIIKKIIGKTKNIDGKITGISGLELKYNEQLSGSPIYYKVMLNRKHQWISETFSTKDGKEPQDIILKKTLAEMLKSDKSEKK